MNRTAFFIIFVPLLNRFDVQLNSFILHALQTIYIKNFGVCTSCNPKSALLASEMFDPIRSYRCKLTALQCGYRRFEFDNTDTSLTVSSELE